MYPLPSFTMLNASVPPAPTVASTTAPVPAPPAGPTFTVIVLVVTEVIAKVDPDAGSVDLGYGCSVKKLSSEHLKIRESSAIVMVSEVVRPWFAIVNWRTPVCEVYFAAVGVNWPETALVTALSNLCSYARSVTAIETGSL